MTFIDPWTGKQVVHSTPTKHHVPEPMKTGFSVVNGKMSYKPTDGPASVRRVVGTNSKPASDFTIVQRGNGWHVA